MHYPLSDVASPLYLLLPSCYMHTLRDGRFSPRGCLHERVRPPQCNEAPWWVGIFAAWHVKSFKLQKVVFFSNLHLMTHSHSGLEISVCIQLKTLKAFVAQIYSEFCVRAKENRAIEQILCVVVIVCCFFRWRHLFKYTFKTFGIKSKMMLISE